MSENFYFIRHLLPTNASIAKRLEDLQEGPKPAGGFKYGENEYYLHDIMTGLLVDALVTAPDLDEAIKKARATTEHTAAQITLSTGEMVEQGQFLFGYDATENKLERDFRQEFIWPMLGERTLHPIDPEQFIAIVKANNSTSHNPEVLRALMFLRTSMKDDFNEIIRFSNLWQGLEVINDKLMDQFQVAEDERWNTCEHCGSKTSPRMSVGIQKLFNDDSIFQDIRRLRGKIMHGTATFDYALVDECTEKNKLLREKLIEGIVLLLALPEDISKQLIKTKRRPLVPQMRAEIKAKLLGFVPQPITNIGQHPHFELVEEKTSHAGPDNKRIKGKKRFNTVCDPLTKFDNIEILTWSYDGSENVVQGMEVKIS